MKQLELFRAKKDRSFWIQRAKQANKANYHSSGIIVGCYFIEPTCDCIPWIGCSICQTTKIE